MYLSQIHKEFLQINRENGQNLNQPFTKKDIQISNKHKNLLKLISYQGEKLKP